MFEWQSIPFFLLTLFFMGLIAGIEMAYYSANRLTIELKKKQGTANEQLVGKFIDNPAGFLGTLLICYTFLLVLFALQISAMMEPVWRYLNLKLSSVQIIIEIILATFVVLIFIEFIPRALFRAHSNAYLHFFARLINPFYILFSPLANGLISMAEWILKYVFNSKLDKGKESFKRSDLKQLFYATVNDERQERNTQLLENAQELPKVKIRQCLVPRKEIIGIPITAGIDEVKKKFAETKLTKLIVFEENIDHIKGYVHQLDIFKKPTSIESIMHSIPAVPESMSASGLMSKLTKERKSIAWVIDEFGGTAGIITMEDVLEELFGEIEDEYDVEVFVEKQIATNEFIFSGRLELDYLKEKYELAFDDEESETLSGFIINHHETIPAQKERIIIGDYEFDIMSVSDTRIETVKLKKLK